MKKIILLSCLVFPLFLSAQVDGTLTAPGSVNGNTSAAPDDCTLNALSREHTIEVTIPSDGKWLFETCGGTTNFDTWLFIGTGTACDGSIGSDNDGCTLASSFLTPNITAGTYYANIEGFGTSISGDYTLTVSLAFPVELLYFRARPRDNKRVELEWATASESNNDYFEIERFGDGASIEKLVEIKGMGSTIEETRYSWTDTRPLQGDNYYRLKQVDYDGTTTAFDLVQVSIEDREKELSLYPNPVSTILHVNLPLAGSSSVFEVSIYDLSGAKLSCETMIDAAGASQPINVESLQPGVYILVATDGTKQYHKRFIVR